MVIKMRVSVSLVQERITIANKCLSTVLYPGKMLARNELLNPISCFMPNTVVAFAILRAEVRSLIPFKTAGTEIRKTAYSLGAFCSLA